MERLTFDGDFCEIAMCRLTNCEDGDCSSKRVWERLKAIENTLGDDYNLDHIRDLLAAEKDGRLLVLPCKVGDTVYVRQAAVGFGYELDKYKEEILIGKITSFRVTETQRFMRIKFRTTKNGRARFGRFYFASIGNTVFLTREEAEAALGGEEHE